MRSQSKGSRITGTSLRWMFGAAFAMIAVMLVGLALGAGTAHAADDGVYTGTASVVEEGVCGGGTIAITVGGNLITSFIVDGSFAGSVPLDDFQLIPDGVTLAITDDAVNETFEPLAGVAAVLTGTFSGDTFTGTLGVESLACEGIALSATLGAPGDTGAPSAGVGPIGSAGSNLTYWAIIASVMAVVGLAVTGVGARIARKA